MFVGLALGLAKSLLGFAQKRSSDQVERFRIETGLKEEEVRAGVELGAQAASVIRSGMQFRVFWIPWSLATIPLAMWFGWGMLDSLANGALWDVAALPPQLKEYADIAWRNLFYAGGGMAAVQAGSKVIGTALGRR